MKLLQNFVLSLLVISATDVTPCSGADILLSLFLPMYTSHTKVMSSIAGALTRHGYNVTLLTSSTAGTKGFQRDAYSQAVHFRFPDMSSEITIGSVIDIFDSSVIKQLTTLAKGMASMRRGCESFFDDSATLALLKESNFDILIGDVFEGCDPMLSRYLEIPFIAVTTSARYPFFYERMFGIPSPSSYVPFAFLPLTDRMSFLERVASFMEHHVVINLMGWTHFRSMNVMKNKLGIAPGRSVQELLSEAELWMSATNFALDFPHPTSPNWVAIGNIADRPAKPLQKDYKSFVEGSGEHGFILFSLGTHVTQFPKQEMAEAFARVFSELPQRVIWRYTGTRPRYLGNNTMLVDWMPQNDLLGHPKAKLFINHGGFTGILEAVYHAVPMLVIPLFAEQASNALRVEVKGMGRRLQKDSLSYETIRAAVKEMLENPSYTENVQRSSKIYRDTPSKADETVVFWVEHILKFGSSHLRTRALELSFIQLHSIDVLAFIVGVILVIVFLFYSCCKVCLSCFKSKKTKVE